MFKHKEFSSFVGLFLICITMPVICFALILLAIFYVNNGYAVSVDDDFDVAEKLFLKGKEDASYAIQGAEKITTLNQNELRNLIGAICAADEEKRQEVATNANNRLQSLLISDFNYFQDRVQKADETLLNAIGKLEKIIQDARYKAKHDKAKNYISEAHQIVDKTDALYRRIESMTRNSRGANHPVTRYLLEEGKLAHKKYQEQGPNCDVAEFTIPGAGRCDCIKIGLHDDVAYVIDAKPDNPAGISKGREQVVKYANALNEELKKTNSTVIAELIKANSSFRKVEKFIPALKCYRVCPDITSDGEFIKTAPKWTDCL